MSISLFKTWDDFYSNLHQNIKPNTVISNITSASPLTQYAEGKCLLTLWHFKVINQHHLSLCSASSLPLMLCSRAFIMFLPLVHAIKMCCSDTCISAKVALQGCQNTLLYCHEHQPPPFFSLKSYLALWRKMAVHKFIGYILFEKSPVSVTLQLILEWFPTSNSEHKNEEILSCLQLWQYLKPWLIQDISGIGCIYFRLVLFLAGEKSVLWYTDLTTVIPLITNDFENPCFVVIYIL